MHTNLTTIKIKMIEEDATERIQNSVEDFFNTYYDYPFERDDGTQTLSAHLSKAVVKDIRLSDVNIKEMIANQELYGVYLSSNDDGTLNLKINCNQNAKGQNTGAMLIGHIHNIQGIGTVQDENVKKFQVISVQSRNKQYMMTFLYILGFKFMWDTAYDLFAYDSGFVEKVYVPQKAQ